MGKLNREVQDQKEAFKHCTHDRQLELTKILNTNEALCSGCRFNILQGEDCFACMRCQFFLHKRCFELPEKIPLPTDIHSLCTLQPLSTGNSHPRFLTLRYKTPYKGEEGFRCDLCAQPGINQWFYCCEQCHYDVHLHCAQGGANFEASCGSRSREDVKPSPLLNAPTFVSRSANLPCGVQGNFHNVHPGNTSVANKPVLASANAITIPDYQAPLNTTNPSIVASHYGLNSAQIAQSGSFSTGFQASGYPLCSATISSTMQPIPMSPNGTTAFTTHASLNNITNPSMGVSQSRPSAAFYYQGTTFPHGPHAYGNNGVLHLNAAQRVNNQQIFPRPNGGGAPRATMVPQNQGFGYGNPGYYGANHGMMGGATVMAFGGMASGFGEAAGGETFQWVNGVLGGGGGGGGEEGSMGLDGSEIMNSYAGPYFGS